MSSWPITGRPPYLDAGEIIQKLTLSANIPICDWKGYINAILELDEDSPISLGLAGLFPFNGFSGIEVEIYKKYRLPSDQPDSMILNPHFTARFYRLRANGERVWPHIATSDVFSDSSVSFMWSDLQKYYYHRKGEKIHAWMIESPDVIISTWPQDAPKPPTSGLPDWVKSTRISQEKITEKLARAARWFNRDVKDVNFVAKPNKSVLPALHSSPDPALLHPPLPPLPPLLSPPPIGRHHTEAPWHQQNLAVPAFGAPALSQHHQLPGPPSTVRPATSLPQITPTEAQRSLQSNTQEIGREGDLISKDQFIQQLDAHEQQRPQQLQQQSGSAAASSILPRAPTRSDLLARLDSMERSLTE